MIFNGGCDRRTGTARAIPARTRSRVLVAVLAGILAVAGCTSGATEQRDGAGGGPKAGARDTTDASPKQTQAVTATPKDSATVVAGTTAAQLALGASRALYQRSPAAVLVADGDQGSLPKATAAAERLGVPLLVTPAAGGGASEGGADGDAVRAELGRLKVRTIVPVGAKARAWARQRPAASPSPTAAPNASGEAVAGIRPPAPLKNLVVLALDQVAGKAAAATARAAGARVVQTAAADPRADGHAIAALSKDGASRVLALGSAFGPADRLRDRVGVAATGVQLPGGGQVLFPGRRMVALYGHPGSSALGSLGQQPLDEAIARAKRVAADYQPLSKEKVVPAFEIITTVSSSSAGGDGNYSNETSVDTLRPWVEAAHRDGLYVVLDLQPGYTDFLTQAKRYAELLKLPNVGLALDPEWRLEPPQRPMRVIGSVGAAEVNKTAEWLADFTRKNHLPQKLLILHQFRLDMISDRSAVDTDYDDIQVLIHADGFGTPGQKFETWNTLHRNAPADIQWGWKNFYRADSPTFTPRETMKVSPTPVFISYQ
jgi:hypothetical protein